MTPEDLKTLIHGVAESHAGDRSAGGKPQMGRAELHPGKAQCRKFGADRTTPDGDVALMFICHTNLVDEFRDLYPDGLTYEGNRAIVLSSGVDADREALKHCIALALTYKLRKRRKRV
jgi:hypothetical protein